MKFVVSSSSFLMRLQAVSKVISGKPAQPILDNILLDSQGRYVVRHGIRQRNDHGGQDRVG